MLGADACAWLRCRLRALTGSAPLRFLPLWKHGESLGLRRPQNLKSLGRALVARPAATKTQGTLVLLPDMTACHHDDEPTTRQSDNDSRWYDDKTA